MRKEEEGIHFHIKWAKLYEIKVIELKTLLGAINSFMLFIFEKSLCWTVKG